MKRLTVSFYPKDRSTFNRGYSTREKANRRNGLILWLRRKYHPPKSRLQLRLISPGSLMVSTLGMATSSTLANSPSTATSRSRMLALIVLRDPRHPFPSPSPTSLPRQRGYLASAMSVLIPLHWSLSLKAAVPYLNVHADLSQDLDILHSLLLLVYLPLPHRRPHLRSGPREPPATGKSLALRRRHHH